jgi:DNA-directed RNA polymerase specialized sigma24 family protein
MAGSLEGWSDEALIEELRRGAHGECTWESAWEALVGRYGCWACAHAKRFVDAHEAEDITQEAFLYLLRKGASLTPKTHVKALLSQVVRSKALNVKRHQQFIQLTDPT